MDDSIVVATWTGRLANALKLALRMSAEAFAETLGAAPRTAAGWNENPDIVPGNIMQAALDTLLSKADTDTKKRFALLAYGRTTRNGESELPTASDLLTDHLLGWVDLHAGWQPGTAQLKLDDRLAQITPHQALQRAAKRARVTRNAITLALNQIYESQHGAYDLYRARCGSSEIATSILTSREWTELVVPLGYGQDALTISPESSAPLLALDAKAATAAVYRIAESVNLQTRVFNAALYCLTDIEVTASRIGGQVWLGQFTDYMLTLDLLENELVDALVDGGGDATWSQLPLRKHYLGSIEQALDLRHRLCAGGALALLAIARPPARGHGADYAIIVQERSARVLNAAGRLAVIPKAFHQPLSDFSDDAQLSATLERELEEELLGREELELAGGPGQHLDPLHRSRLSEPMRWLADRRDSDVWRTECTGFGLNLISGNYEFASLIAIEDEEWWTLFGGHLVTNWEAGGIRIYSSLDIDGIATLVNDERWSNEGLFAFLQGIRHLARMGGPRINLPSIELEYDK
ncbi:hypothetical protein [Mycobacteroides abscessus]|uniref:Uncharacterized protein n=1 Tax=Mycobacteroides abscessus 1948 TaxID=1299323 RepID=A0A829QJ10_9MYCO|nr:hypothetical protein [Mycobacteroides abscessus]EUA63044.1 hypothetical protein I542_3201 [Mycobacteroides abscessus 1948]EIU37091.1 hypothetical protein MA6G0125S_4542 [Mycobacteroides abscessus 6G-0125-S]EIU39733.1 hypothetical protein MA6G0125R_3495 [Mycobacteroides abscessus 6G-0125-R]EIU51992.1 hypothetical protein MA6G1108_4464 [Mycobacteroides abscessus 6G-1108]EIU53995.1 hypothetical protein MA6G0728S_4224 [Mycobacteroides abscessus 6G-0728-S]